MTKTLALIFSAALLSATAANAQSTKTDCPNGTSAAECAKMMDDAGMKSPGAMQPGGGGAGSVGNGASAGGSNTGGDNNGSSGSSGGGGNNGGNK